MAPLRVDDGESKLSSEDTRDPFWMRWVSLAGVHRVLHLVARSSEGLSTAEMDQAIKDQGLYILENKKPPARSTLYHVRNALLHLDLCRSVGRRVFVNHDSPIVINLLDQPPVSQSVLLHPVREILANAILRNEECRSFFFDLFVQGDKTYTSDYFRRCAAPVRWRLTERGVGKKGGWFSKAELLSSTIPAHLLPLDTPSAVNGVLWCVRRWALNDLSLIDEVETGNGEFLMFPIRQPDKGGIGTLTNQILAQVATGKDEWTTLAIKDLIDTLCVRGRHSINTLMQAIQRLYMFHPGEIVLIPTARAFATLLAHRQQEQMVLRGYYQDERGRYISHLRFHGSIGESTFDKL